MRPEEEQQDRPQELLEADEDEGEDEIVLIGRSKGFAIQIFPTDPS